MPTEPSRWPRRRSVPSIPTSPSARDLYNEGLRDCLRSAQEFGRIDARSHLLVNTPAGSQTVPIAHHGFVWQAEDFGPLADPTRLGRNPNEHGVSTLRPGLGADVAVKRPNPNLSPSDRFLPREAAFNATALLRPDLEAWLGPRSGKPPADVLEFHDPLRVRDGHDRFAQRCPWPPTSARPTPWLTTPRRPAGRSRWRASPCPRRCSTRPTSGCSSPISRARSRSSSSTACSTIRSSSTT